MRGCESAMILFYSLTLYKPNISILSPELTELYYGIKTIGTSMKIIRFGPLLLALLSASALGYNIDGFTVSGDIRTGWVSYDYNNPNGDPQINKGHKDSYGFYVVPKIAVQTPSINGFSAKIMAAGATDFGLNDEDKQSRNFVFDPVENKSFALIQELFIDYTNDRHHALIGRNEIVTPMIDADDWYMLANSFETLSYTNSSLEKTRFFAGFFRKMAGVWDSGANGTEFNYMSTASFVPQFNKDEAGNAGVYYVAAEHHGDKHHGQLWEYYAEDLYNMLFAQYNMKSGSSKFNYDFGLQFIDWSQVGKLKASPTEIDYSLYSIKYDGTFDNGWSFATGASKYTDGAGQGDTLGAWGGYPYFANGMIFHFFEAGNLRNAESYKLQGGYDLSKIGVDDLGLKIRYTDFSLDPQYSISSNGTPQTFMRMIGIQVTYSFLKTGYFTGTYEKHRIEEEEPVISLRLIGGFRF